MLGKAFKKNNLRRLKKVRSLEEVKDQVKKLLSQDQQRLILMVKD